MLTKVHLVNFKCFEALSLPLAPLTVLTGFNAAGKSTALQPILLLAQALREGRRSNYLPLNGPLARLGTPGEVFMSGTDEIKFAIELMIGEIKYENGEIQEDIIKTSWLLNVGDQGRGLYIKAILVEHDNFIQQVNPENEFDWRLLPYTSELTALEQLFNSLSQAIYLSAVRLGTAEVFPAPEESSPVHADVGLQGEFAPWWFQRYMDEEIEPARCHPSDPAKTLRRQLNAWAGELFPGAQSNAQRLDKTSLVRLELRTSDTDDWRRPANIGYGLTYAFPVLVAGLLAHPGQLLIIDSPEAHLHPLGQSRMGRFLAHMAAAGVQILIETHSDHILNGARLAVRDGVIAPDKIAIHFFNHADPRQASGGARVTSPLLDKQGNLSEWPEGFFDQSEKDMARLAGWE